MRPYVFKHKNVVFLKIITCLLLSRPLKTKDIPSFLLDTAHTVPINCPVLMLKSGLPIANQIREFCQYSYNLLIKSTYNHHSFFMPSRSVLAFLFGKLGNFRRLLSY